MPTSQVSTRIHRITSAALLLASVGFLLSPASAQFTAPGNLAGGFAPPGGTVPFDNSRLNNTMLNRDAENDLSPLENPAISVSKLDLKAPGKARKEYDKGSQLLARKDFKGASEHLAASISIYPDFVAAHNALGTSYLGLGQDSQARDEFAKAVSLDDHLPISHLNLGCAELALKHYPAAEAAVEKASTIAPLDMQVLTALAYAQLMNHNYLGVIVTANKVHGAKHKGAAIVHYYAAAAWDNQSDLKQSAQQLQYLLKEDPKSPAAEQALGILQHLKEDQFAPKVPATVSLTTTDLKFVPSEPASNAPAVVPTQVRKLMQDAKEQQQVAEAESICDACEAANLPTADEPSGIQPSEAPAEPLTRNEGGFVLHADVDEVSVFFAATDHGRAVGDLSQSDVTIRDSHKPPVVIKGFRSEAQLPLRLGLVIDTSESITSRFAFEQAAGIDFIKKVVTGKDDLAFVVGFSNSVLLVQDFTGSNDEISAGIGKLAPGGGTSLWDAVSFAADKLASRGEAQPVARVLVVISDGEDNSSSTTLKEAIEAAVHGEVIVYAVSTRDNRDTATTFFDTHSGQPTNTFVGDRALKVLGEASGGTAFFPGSLGYLNHSLADLQQVIRSRYLVSYKPDHFKRNGQYRTIDITAEKSGHKLRVYARKGYFAQLNAPGGGGL